MTQPYTRTNLLCRDCRLLTTELYVNGKSFFWCGHRQATYQDPVDGSNARMGAETMRMSGPCGYAGMLWEPKDQTGV